MYKIIKLFSYLIRQLWLPNPFYNLVDDKGAADIINLIFGAIFVKLAYSLTGIWYNKENSVIGSLGFLINYMLLTFSLLFITMFVSNVYIVTVLFMILYIMLCIIESDLFAKKYML